ncbi:ABC transporter ATP-binding protein [Microvirga brassicacearum]|uniref:ABC transporter ATP-binding protein n=1 Tax=Microvirga brassicacearum TaxID=2580413 RepID=A0A5N3PFY6_9HYPH|nr:ABC transporter ATP-binding protein [Microvirga brassicacearum]KAB0268624.1 ABC transporter ATP-binding protein [Microvirga brassicacearum]
MIGPVLSVRGLEVAFGSQDRRVPVVRGVDFDVYPNEVLCIVGESGSGKSVTALAVSGLLPATAKVEGSILLGGTEVIGADAESLRNMRGQEVGFIFQDPTTTLNPVLPVGRQVTEGQVAHGRLSKADAPARAVELLREVDIADPLGRAGQYPHQFSGGMRQRAVIAMAMAGRPKLILADEPTTALDVTVQAQVLSVLARRQAETGAAVILITHDLGVVAEIAHRVAVMYGGRIVETGPVGEIFKRPRHPYTAALLQSIPRIDTGNRRLDPIPGQPPNPSALPSGCAFHPRCVIGRDRTRCRTEDPMLHRVGETQFSACHFSEQTNAIGIAAQPRCESSRSEIAKEPLLIIDQLKVHFPVKAGLLRRTVGSVRAVDGVSLTVNAGETVSLVGESGCGKTTTGRAVMGLIKATGGNILFNGQSIRDLGRAGLRKARRQMQYIFQDPYSSLNPVLTVADIVAEPLRIHGIYDEMGGASRIAELFDMVGLSRTMLGRYPREFSGGQKQRIGIARALALQPRLLILDEPVAALDVSIQAQIINLLQDLQRELGLSYLFIAHNLSVVRHISDRVAVMYLGRIVEESTRDSLYEAATHPYTQSLLSAAPVPDPAIQRKRRRIVLQGEIPNPASPPSGCYFHPRCFRASARCATEMPPFEQYLRSPTRSACHHAGPLAEGGDIPTIGGSSGYRPMEAAS